MTATATVPVTAEATCRHCGTLYRPVSSGDDSGFCCAGCQFVAGLIDREGLDQFYDLKGAKTLPPVKSLAFQKRDYDWLRDNAHSAEAEIESGPAKLTIGLQGISCAACVWLIERLFRRHPGGLRILVDAQLGRMRLWWEPGSFDIAAFAEELQRFGYAAGPVGDQTDRAHSESRSLLTRTGVAGGLALNAMAFTLPRYLGMADDFLLARLFELIIFASASLALLVSGGYFFRRAWRGLTIGSLHMDLPISLGLIAAYLGSLAGWAWRIESLVYFDFVAVFAFLMLGGRWLQQAALEKNRTALQAGDHQAREITRLGNDGAGEKIPVTALAIGDQFQLGPGESLPVTASLQNDAAECSFEWINGEPEPRVVTAGREISSGAVNVGRSATRWKALEAYDDSLLAKLFAVSESAARNDSSVDLGRVLRVYLTIVLATAFLGGIAWAASGPGWIQALQVFISVLVVSCPCALGVALPFLDELVITRLRNAGLFLQNSALWSRLRRVRQIVFDKTGTLTRETPRLANFEILTRLTPEERSVLAGLVADSRHPAGRAIREALARFDSTKAKPISVCETVGKGVSWRDESAGIEWALGKPGWRNGKAIKPSIHTVFSRDGKCLAAFEFEEALRDDAIEEVAALENSGYRLAILSGDASERVRQVAGKLGIDQEQVIGDSTPEQKARWIETHDPKHTLYIGDGANDSLAFDAALCRGTPAIGSGVLEQKSDFYFLGQGLHAIRRLFELTRRRRRVLTAILAAAIAYNIGAVAVALAGWMNPLLAAVLMPISSIATLAIASTAKKGR